jgi:hypothetical protein
MGSTGLTRTLSEVPGLSKGRKYAYRVIFGIVRRTAPQAESE